MKRFLIVLLIAVSCFAAACVTAFADEAFDEDKVIVVMKPKSTFRLMSAAETNYDFGGLNIAETEKIAELPSNTYSLFSLSGASKREMLCLTLRESGMDKVMEAVEALNNMDGVDYAQPNYKYYLESSANDTRYSEQYSLSRVSAEKVWDLNIDCSETVIAVIDSGTVAEHEDLKDNLWVDKNGNVGWDFIDNDGNPDDTVGHGTHVSGILGAVTNNNKGIASLGRNVKVAVFKTFSETNGDTKLICTALEYMQKYEKENGVKFPVVNFSFGSGYYDSALYDLMKANSDKLFVVAASNTNTASKRNIDNPNNRIYPACYGLDNILVVANSSQADLIVSSSCYGVESVDLAAPGQSILSTYIDTTESGKTDCYYTMGGTSMATPLVSSAAAVLRTKCPWLSAVETKQLILDGADHVSMLDSYVSGGRRLNAYKPIQLAMSTVTVTFNPRGGSDVESQDILYGENASEPDIPVREGYDFIGWELDGKTYDFAAPVTEDITLDAVWERRSFTITWITDGVRDETNVYYGDTPEHSAPHKDSDDRYDYVFIKWSPDITAATENAVYTAVFTAVDRNTGEEIEIYDSFKSRFSLVKYIDNDGDAVLKVGGNGSQDDTGDAPSQAPQEPVTLVCCVAEYDENGALINVETAEFTYGTVLPDKSGKNCRIFIWTKSGEPVTEVITDMGNFFGQ